MIPRVEAIQFERSFTSLASRTKWDDYLNSSLASRVKVWKGIKLYLHSLNVDQTARKLASDPRHLGPEGKGQRTGQDDPGSDLLTTIGLAVVEGEST